MKKIITVSVSLILSSLLISNQVSAQSVDKGVAFAAIKNKSALADYIRKSDSADNSNSGENVKALEKDIKASKAHLKAIKANLRATTNFQKLFKEAPNAMWFTEENAIVAHFNKDGVNTRVVYDKKGYLIHSLTSFQGEKAPEHIKAILEEVYPNADITVAVQVKEGNMDFFIVNLEDKRTIKQVSVYDGETNLMHEWKKSR